MTDLLEDTLEFTFTNIEKQLIDDTKELMKGYENVRFQTDDAFLSKMLNCSDWNPQKAIDRILAIYKVKFEHPEWFATKSTYAYKDLIELGIRYPLNQRDKNGRVVFIYKLGGIEPKTTIFDVAKLDDMWFESLFMIQKTQKNGISIIVDCKDVPYRVIKWLTPKNCKICSIKCDLLPISNMFVHFVNTSTIFDTGFAIAKPFLSRKMKEKMHLHKDWKSLHEYLGFECLPEEYGGQRKIDKHEQYQHLYKRDNYLTYNKQFGIIV